jgi:hypothetical protein
MDHDEFTSSQDETESSESTPHMDVSDVGVRIVYTLLFAIVLSVLESLTFAVVAYQLIYSLVTRRVPGGRVQSFANSIVAYFRQILRYITHTDSVIPFPFSDFPEPLEPVRRAYLDEAPEHAEPTTV